jgi:hypothetical protein
VPANVKLANGGRLGHPYPRGSTYTVPGHDAGFFIDA